MAFTCCLQDAMAVLTIKTDQQYRPVIRWAWNVVAGESLGQVFRCETTGKLMAIEFDGSPIQWSTNVLKLEILEWPAKVFLTSSSLRASDLSDTYANNSHRSFFDFSQTDFVAIAGQDYLLRFVTDSPDYTTIILGCDANQCESGGYPFGTSYTNDRDRNEDLHFATYVIADEPVGKAPQIVVPPLNPELWDGQETTLRVLGTGSLPMTYQWYKDGIALQNQTNSFLKVEATPSSRDATYEVSVANAWGQVRSPSSQSTVYHGPFFQWNYFPNQYWGLGGRAVLYTQARGKGEISYQWFRDGQPITQATQNTFRFKARMEDNGMYWVVATDQLGSIESPHFQVQIRDDSHRIRWTNFLSYPRGSATVTPNGSILQMSGNDLLNLISSSGETLWTYGSGACLSPILINNDLFFLAGPSFITSSLDLKLISNFSSGAYVGSDPAYDQENNRIFIADYSGKLKCYVPGVGYLWERQVSDESFTVPLVYSPTTRTVCLYSYLHGSFEGYNASNGEFRWSFAATNYPYSSPAVHPSGTLYVGATTNLVAFDSLQGKELWRFKNTNYITSEPILTWNSIIVGTETGVTAVDYQGNALWSVNLESTAGPGLALAADGTLYVTHATRLSAINIHTATLLWTYFAPDYIRDGVAIGKDGSVLINPLQGGSDDAIYALHGNSPLADVPWPKNRGNAGRTGAGLKSKPPVIASIFTNLTSIAGSSVQIQAVVSGSQPLALEWQLNGTKIPSATNSTLQIDVVTLQNQGVYSISASNEFGIVSMPILELLVIPVPQTWIDTAAGNGNPGDSDDFDARFGELRSPGKSVVLNGSAYIPSGNKLRRLTPAGALETIAGQNLPGWKDAPGTNALLNSPAAIIALTEDNLVLADYGNHNLRNLQYNTWNVTTLAGDGQPGFINGAAAVAQFSNPTDVAFTAANEIYILDTGNHSVRKLSHGVVSSYAGGSPGFRDGPINTSQFRNPQGITVDLSSNIFIADSGNHRIRKISSTGIVTTVAGNGVPGEKDGESTAASITSPNSVLALTNGAILFTESSKHSIRMLTPNGLVMTLAGNPQSPGKRDGIGRATRLNQPSGLTLDPNGIIFFSDRGNHQLRRLSFAPLPTRSLPNGNLTIELKPWLTLSGQIGQSFDILISERTWGPWTVLTNITLTSTNMSWLDTDNATTKKYYRSVLK